MLLFFLFNYTPVFSDSSLLIEKKALELSLENICADPQQSWFVLKNEIHYVLKEGFEESFFMYPKNTNYLKEVRAKKLTWTLDKDKYNIYSPGHIDYTRMTLVDSLYLCEIIALHEKKDAYFILISISKKFVANTGVISWNDDEVCYVFALKFNKKGELEKVKFWEGF